MTVISPTVGRQVHYWRNPVHSQADQPEAATVTYVWNDRMVNLQVLDHYGNSRPMTSILLYQEGDPLPVERYAEWMTYQKGQAAKTEALEAEKAKAPDALLKGKGK